MIDFFCQRNQITPCNYSKELHSVTSVKVAFLILLILHMIFYFILVILFTVGQNLFDINPWTGEKNKK